MRRTLSAVVLTLAFCCPVSAGVIHNPAPTPEPLFVQPAPVTTNTDTDATDVSDVLTQVTFDLLAVLPALL